MPGRAHFSGKPLKNRHIVLMRGDGAHPLRQFVTVQVGDEWVLPLLRVHLWLVQRLGNERAGKKAVSLMKKDKPSRWLVGRRGSQQASR